jgi:hypothetical protein
VLNIICVWGLGYADELMDIDGEDSGTKVTRANYLRIVLGGSDQGVMMLACKALGMGPLVLCHVAAISPSC